MRFRIFGKLFTVPKAVIYIFAASLVACAAILGSCRNREAERNLPIITEITPVPGRFEEETDEKNISVYIVGCVANPGVYSVPEGAVLNFLVLMAGGLTEDADTESINLATKLYDGEMIRIPSTEDEDKSFIIEDTQESGQTSQGGKVNINTADLKMLMTLPGVGETTAKKILSYRQEHGPFNSPEDLMKVPGIKEGKFASIKDYITV